MHAQLLHPCPTLHNPVDHNLPGSSVHGILQARILEWAAMPSPRDLSDPGIEPTSLAFPALAGGFFTTSMTWEAPVWYGRDSISLDFQIFMKRVRIVRTPVP